MCLRSHLCIVKVEACALRASAQQREAYATRIALCFNAYYNVYVDSATLTTLQVFFFFVFFVLEVCFFLPVAAVMVVIVVVFVVVDHVIAVFVLAFCACPCPCRTYRCGVGYPPPPRLAAGYERLVSPRNQRINSVLPNSTQSDPKRLTQPNPTQPIPRPESTQPNFTYPSTRRVRPEIFWKLLRLLLRGSRRVSGPFRTWQDARRSSESGQADRRGRADRQAFAAVV